MNSRNFEIVCYLNPREKRVLRLGEGGLEFLLTKIRDLLDEGAECLLVC